MNRFWSLTGAATLVAGTLGLTSAASASPAGPAFGTAPAAAFTRVAQGCGPGWHRTPWGHCRPHRGGYGGPRFHGHGYGHHHGYRHHGHRY